MGKLDDLECAPLSGCGTQHPLCALGGTRVLLAAAPTTAPCFCHWRRSQLLHCGVGGVQRKGGGSRNTPPCLWPSGASLPACAKQKLSPRSVHFSGSLLVSKENIPGGNAFCKRHQTLNTRLRSAREALRHFPTQKRSNTCSITASEAFSPVRSHRAASASSTQTDTASSPKPPAAASSAPATASRARSAAES